ncbi:MAG: hypothetical protein JWR80_7854 [Bradyrhizobium sp.]|nr:hypothetical protein [Bradyrhizobium sp.]
MAELRRQWRAAGSYCFEKIVECELSVRPAGFSARLPDPGFDIRAGRALCGKRGRHDIDVRKNIS